MKTITRLNDTLKDLDNTELLDNFQKPITLKQLIAQTIRRGSNINAQGQSRFDVMRADEIARKIYNCNGKIELEDADFNMVKQIIEEDMVLNVMSKAACLQCLEKDDKGNYPQGISNNS